ncbi:ribonuclease H-like domain-containing protein [Tanacetum coccineum]
MRMEQYLTHIDYALWEVIMNGYAPAIASASTEGPIPPKIAEQKLARKNELKAKSTLLLAILDEHLLKFHGSRMQRPFMGSQLIQCQKLISQLEIHGEVIHRQDANLKLLWEILNHQLKNNIALIMRNKTDLDTLSMDDLYNNLKVYEAKIKGQSSSSLNSQNVAFVSSKNTSIMFSFFVNQSNSLQLDNEDLEQIDTDDLEEMDLKWQDSGLRLQENARNPTNHGNRNGDNTRRVVPVETPANALVVTDGMGYDWSYQAEEGPTNFALMAHLSSGSSSSSSLNTEVRDNSITKLKNQLAEALREKDDLKLKLEKFETSSMKLTKLINSQISVNNKSGVGFDSQMNENELHDCHMNKSEVREKDDLKLKLEKFETSSMKLTKLINSQISVNNKSGVGFDSQMNENELHDCHLNKSEVFESASDSSVNEIEEENNQVNVRPSAPIIEEWESDSDDDYSDNDSVFRPKSDQTKPKFTKINFVKSDENVKTVNKENTNRQVEYPKKSQSPRDNRRNLNGMMTQKLGNAVATKSEQVPISAAKQSSPRAVTSISTARPVNIAAPKSKVNDALPTTYSYFKAHSLVRRAFNQKSAAKTNNFNEKVNTARVNNVTTAGPKAVVSAAVRNGENAVKSSACWIWRPTRNVIDHNSKDNGSYMLKRFDYGNPQYTLQDQGIFDSGCSRHMTGNKSFLTDYQEIDGGFVAFGGSPKGGKITRKGKIRTGKLDFEDVYFVKELKFNLFSISQMCDKKNSVLFTETECLVLSPDFKLLDESQVLLKVPRQNNMYSFDLKNVVPSGGLTCLFVKAIIDESNLWHKRLGHINFKTMNKLVRGNLVRGFPSKLFENDHTCVACQKGKQHKVSYSVGFSCWPLRMRLLMILKNFKTGIGKPNRALGFARALSQSGCTMEPNSRIGL